MARICVVMWYDEAVASYGDLNYRINQEYCSKHGMTLLKCDVRRHPERHPAWERLPLILEHLHRFDYVVWIDADAHFYLDAPSLEELVSEHSSRDLIFSADKAPNSNINSGLFIARNTKFSREFIKQWSNDETLYHSNRFPWWWEQGVLIDMWEKNVQGVRNHAVVLERGVLQHFEPSGLRDDRGWPFAVHLSETRAETRVAHSSQYIAEKIE